MVNVLHSFTPQTILLIEDEPRVGCTLAKMLTQLGYAVVLCQNAVDALEALKNTPDIFAIVADYRLYDSITGLDILATSQKIYPHIRRILISGLLIPESDEQRWPQICHAFLSKPFTWNQMQQALHPVMLGNESSTPTLH